MNVKKEDIMSLTTNNLSHMLDQFPTDEDGGLILGEPGYEFHIAINRKPEAVRDGFGNIKEFVVNGEELALSIKVPGNG